jgi:hypothetical protein
MATNPTTTETERGKKGRRSRPVTLGKINLLLASSGCSSLSVLTGSLSCPRPLPC